EEEPILQRQGHAAAGVRADRLERRELAEDQPADEIRPLQLQEPRDDSLDGLAIRSRRDVAGLLPGMLLRLYVVLEHEWRVAECPQQLHHAVHVELARAGQPDGPRRLAFEN